MLINEIINKVAELRKQYALNSIPVDLNKMLSEEKFEIIEEDFSKFEKKVNKSISGILYIDGKTRQILVNIKDNVRRKNFTKAHELGHYYLHYNQTESEVFISFRGDSNKRETEANRFAAELLLPNDKIKEEYELALFPTASYLAEKFDVSKQAMSIKLEQMGLNYIEL